MTDVANARSLQGDHALRTVSGRARPRTLEARMRARLLMVAAIASATLGSLGLVGAGPAAASQPTPMHPDLTYATSAQWLNRPQGGTLSITPSGIAQAIGIPAATGVMNNALSIAGFRPYSQAVYNSLFEQLQ